MYSEKFDVLNITRSSKTRSGSFVATETSINIFVNDTKVASLMATPDMLRELAIGHLVCEGMMDNPRDILVNSDAKFTVDCIKKSLHHIGSDVYAKTRGTHSASLIDQDGNLIKKAIDAGRHNTIDKVVGGAILGGIDLRNLFLLSTARQSAGMVMKVARAGIPMIVSKTAPISSGIEAAQMTGVALVCFAREDRLSIYSHPERVL